MAILRSRHASFVSRIEGLAKSEIRAVTTGKNRIMIYGPKTDGAHLVEFTFLEHDHSFGPEDIASMSAALEAALGKLGLVDRMKLRGGGHCRRHRYATRARIGLEAPDVWLG
jgi:hypothetical protein